MAVLSHPVIANKSIMADNASHLLSIFANLSSANRVGFLAQAVDGLTTYELYILQQKLQEFDQAAFDPFEKLPSELIALTLSYLSLESIASVRKVYLR